MRAYQMSSYFPTVFQRNVRPVVLSGGDERKSSLVAGFRTPAALLVAVLLMYVLFAGRLRFDFPTTPTNYFSHLAVAFLHGQVGLVTAPAITADLSFYRGGVYLNWGPGPILLILPFILAFGIDVSDAFYTALIGAVSPMLLYLALVELERLGLLVLSQTRRLILSLFFGFGTVHFYLSVTGTVWFTSQIAATLYMLAGLYCALRYANRQWLGYALAAGAFCGLALVTRLTAVAILPAIVLILLLPLGKSLSLQRAASGTLAFAIVVGCFIFAAGIYNYVRFGSFTETGYAYHNFTRWKLGDDYRQHGFFNLAYVPRNAHHMLLSLPEIRDRAPYVRFHSDGDSILATSPLFLLLGGLAQPSVWRDERRRWLLACMLACAAVGISVLLLFWGTGWRQFGYRYLLDVIPMLMILLAVVAQRVPIALLGGLAAISIGVNCLGTLWAVDRFV